MSSAQVECILTFIDSVAKVALPAACIDERHKRIYVRPTATAAYDNGRLYHRQLLKKKMQAFISVTCNYYIQAWQILYAISQLN